MSGDVVIGVDAGTSVMKAVAFDLEGRQLAVAARPNGYASLPGGGVEQELPRTWDDCAACLRDLAERLPDLPARVAAIGVTGQGDGTWLVDAAGEPLGRGWLWLDSRAAGIVDELDASGARATIYRHTGVALTACTQSSQLVWLDRHVPELLDRAATVFHCKDWLYFNLTGERATDLAEGNFTFGSFERRRYVPEVLEALGLAHRRHLLPPMLDGTRDAHGLTAAAAAATGLREGTPVALGYLDVLCTALGAGLYAPGRQVGVSIVGSTGMHMRLWPDASQAVMHDEPSGYIMPFMVPGTVAQMQSNMAATLNIDWVVDLACGAMRLLGQEVRRPEALTAIDRRVLEARPGAAIYHPYIHEAGERGPFVNARARAQVLGLTDRVGYLDLARSVYEGLALAARDCYAAIGHTPDEVRLAGGASRSRSFKTILASALDTPLRESEREEAGAAGTAMMAAVAIGAYPDVASVCRTWVDPLLGAQVAPQPELVRLYDALYPVYVDGRRGMASFWADLARVREAMPS